jgi:hypothetical protein
MEKLKNGLLRVKVSFDFDGTLAEKHVQKYAAELIEKGHEVWIVTSRFGDDKKYKKFFNTSTNVDLTNNDLWEVAEELGIPKERIHFTDMEDKWRFLKDKSFLWHLDDDWVENRLILNNCKMPAINVWGNNSWEHKCNRIIKRAQFKELERETR